MGALLVALRCLQRNQRLDQVRSVFSFIAVLRGLDSGGFVEFQPSSFLLAVKSASDVRKANNTRKAG